MFHNFSTLTAIKMLAITLFYFFLSFPKKIARGKLLFLSLNLFVMKLSLFCIPVLMLCCKFHFCILSSDFRFFFCKWKICCLDFKEFYFVFRKAVHFLSMSAWTNLCISRLRSDFWKPVLLCLLCFFYTQMNIVIFT